MTPTELAFPRESILLSHRLNAKGLTEALLRPPWKPREKYLEGG
jgi:hypothetical protein